MARLCDVRADRGSATGWMRGVTVFRFRQSVLPGFIPGDAVLAGRMLHPGVPSRATSVDLVDSSAAAVVAALSRWTRKRLSPAVWTGGG